MHQVQPVANASNATPIADGSGDARPAVTIVILAWNAWEHTERCLRSLRPTLGQKDQVVVVDNGSTDGTREALAAYDWLEVVANDENQGFARGCNQGAANARGGVVVFLNSDTVVPSGWLDGLVAPFEAGDVGAVGPRSDNVSGRQAVKSAPDPLTDSRAFSAFAESWQTGHRGQTAETRRLVGFCLAVRTSSFHALGGFDDRFEIGGFEDDDLCRRLREHNLRLLISHGSFVHHRGHASFDANGIDWQVAQFDNQVRFEEKWGPDALRLPVLVTACMIVKNEEQMLPACLESVRDAVDEIVVYDTGSDDRTVEIARAAGATVVLGEWEDSFSAARNAALGARHRRVGAVHRRRRTAPDRSRRPPGSALRPFGRCRGLSRRDREPARTGEPAVRPHGDPRLPAAGRDLAAPAARAGRRGGRPLPRPPDRVPVGRPLDPSRLRRRDLRQSPQGGPKPRARPRRAR